ncbi:hypothetical protein Ddye_020238 [Dipteronia dyeriana]|uniref:DUF4283 domain-containing protein n=1 Tax=Dipteronia dyeriana TaxID=168575 RepID=A0AAD9TZT6_9ROSI|nr:hypothetical protein Ddye_020238 [Dipteronia dyeriana]
MLQKLHQKWTLIGQWQLTDVEDRYFIARFQMQEDLDFVLTGGPMVITNQYLAVQMWRPNFIHGEDEIRMMPIWVSYRINGRYNTGTKNFGSRIGNIRNSGGVGADSKANNRPPRYEVEESSKMAEDQMMPFRDQTASNNTSSPL